MGIPAADQLASIPVIDFSGLNDPAKRKSVCSQITQACETVGFFEISNSGMPMEVVDEALDVNRYFYDLPLEEKVLLTQNLKEKKPSVPVFQLGYKRFPVLLGVENCMEEMVFRHYPHRKVNPDDETDKMISTAEDMTGDIDPTQNWWPTNPPKYRQRVENIAAQLGKLADDLLDLFSEALGLPPNYLREEYHRNITVPRVMNVHHFPRGEKPDVDGTGILPHRDSSVFSIICQGNDTNGLQINPHGEWIPWKARKGSIVVNVGDILETWSNGRFRSILHRVISNKLSGRISFVYLLLPVPGPEADCICEPIPKLITKDSPPNYRSYSYLDFFNNKMLQNSVSLLERMKIVH